jgi:hypothetical protein
VTRLRAWWAIARDALTGTWGLLRDWLFEEAIRGLVRLESEERDRAFRFAKECRAANLDERLVRLAEGQQELVADYVNGVLAALGHDVQDPIVLRVLSEQLPALGASA